MCRLSAETQPVTCAPCSVTTHCLPLPHRTYPDTCIWDTSWVCWISITLSSTAAEQISPRAHSRSGCSHWIHSLAAGEQIVHATRNVHNPAHLHYGQECPAAMSHLISQHLNYSAFQGHGQGKNEGKFTRNKKTREKSYLNELWFTYITLFKPFLMLKSSRNTQRPVISQHQNNLMNAQRLC